MHEPNNGNENRKGTKGNKRTKLNKKHTRLFHSLVAFLFYLVFDSFHL